MRGYPSRYVVVDTETYERRSSRVGWGKDQSLRIGVAKVYDGSDTRLRQHRYIEFNSAEAFMSELLEMPKTSDPIYLIAHNLGFDIRILGWFRWLTSGHLSLMPPKDSPGSHRYSTPLATFDALPIMMRFFRRDGQQIMCVDSMNWIDQSLKRIGEMIGFRKGAMPHKDDPDHEWFTYCRRDVDLLDACMRRIWGWCQLNRWPDWHVTPASQARAVFRLRYARKRPVRPDDPDSLALDRRAYYGGRLDCFRVGRIDRRTYQIDVNGLYPAVMRHRPYPCEVLERRESARSERWTGQIDPRECTAEVWIDSPTIPWPVRYADGTLWVTGKMRTILPGPELEYAVEMGVVRRLGRWTRYRVEDLFTGYVDDLWKQRIDARNHGDGLVAHCAKRMLNALHGKFGQRGGQWEYAGRLSPSGTYANGKIVGSDRSRDADYRCLDGHTYVRANDDERDDGFVAISSWCTSYARITMDALISWAGRDTVHYQCTDSLLVSGDGLGRLQLRNLIDPDRIGAFKLEQTYDWIDIHTVNQIETSVGGKHSGVKPGSPLVAPGLYECEQWETLSDGIFHGRVDTVATRKQCVRPATKYVRGFINEDGSTRPWKVDEWEISPEGRMSLTVDDGSAGRE